MTPCGQAFPFGVAKRGMRALPAFNSTLYTMGAKSPGIDFRSRGLGLVSYPRVGNQRAEPSPAFLPYLIYCKLTLCRNSIIQRRQGTVLCLDYQSRASLQVYSTTSNYSCQYVAPNVRRGNYPFSILNYQLKKAFPKKRLFCLTSRLRV